MEPQPRSALEGARVEATEALSRFGRLPGSMRLAYASVAVLALGSLMPWVDFVDGATLGIESLPGGLVLLVAVGAFISLAHGARRPGADGGAVVGLGLVALAVSAANFLNVVLGDAVSPAYGIYVTLAAAVALLLAGVLLFGAGNPLSRFGPLPGSMRVAYASVPVLVLGSLMPWLDVGIGWQLLGIDTMVGALVLLAAVGAVVALAPQARNPAAADSGAVAGLGLLALAVTAAWLLHAILQDGSPVYGFYVTLAGALALFLAGVLMFVAGRPTNPDRSDASDALPRPD
jgi:hypothetical protein